MKLLIVVDMQNDFVSGTLGFPEAKSIIPNIQDKIRQYRKNEDLVFFTRDIHYSSYYEETREGRNLPVLHCVSNSEGAEIIDELKQLGQISPNEIFNKNTFGLSCHNIINMMQEIPNMKLDQIESIEICGLVTNFCVLSVAVTLQANITYPDIIIDAACCASPDIEAHNKALDVMENLHMKVINRRGIK